MGSVGASGVAAKAESLDKALRRRDRDYQRAPSLPDVASGEHCTLPSVVQERRLSRQKVFLHSIRAQNCVAVLTRDTHSGVSLKCM